MIGNLRISLGTLRHNAQTLRQLVAPAQIAFVVKANAYGHGLAAVARSVAEYADRFCVYAVEEGLALRTAGVTIPILVLGPAPIELLEEALTHDLELTLWNADWYREAVANAARTHGKPFRVHMKIDTGVRRLGLEPRDAPQAIERCAMTPGIEVAGIFSHLASAEELHSELTFSQVALLESVASSARINGSAPRPLRHIAASAAAMMWPQTRLDMVRVGIALYGLWPSKETRGAVASEIDLKPALSFESRIVAVRRIEAGATVGYGGTFRAKRPTRVGVVPLGYADGIPRALSNTGAFLVAGQRCALAGRVCMNMSMLDLGTTAARPGDHVTLIGSSDGAGVSADDWAEWADTINYEIVTRLPASLPRMYEA